MTSENTGVKNYKSSQEKVTEGEVLRYLMECPIPHDQILENLGLFLTAKNFSRILFMHHIYQQILEVPGIVIDFGTRWGQNLALFSTFRGVYEPFNRHRKLVGFDTFAGFPRVLPQDGTSNLMAKGNISVTENYVGYLDGLMGTHEGLNPLSPHQEVRACGGRRHFNPSQVPGG